MCFSMKNPVSTPHAGDLGGWGIRIQFPGTET